MFNLYKLINDTFGNTNPDTILNNVLFIDLGIEYIDIKNQLKRVETDERNLLTHLKKEHDDLLSKNNIIIPEQLISQKMIYNSKLGLKISNQTRKALKNVL